MKKEILLLAALALTVACSTAPAPAPTAATAPQLPAIVGSILRVDPALDEIVPKEAQIEKIATGFIFTEGPLWRPAGNLWFSDVMGNVVRQWSPDGKVVEIFRPGGYTPWGANALTGPNAMIADKDDAVLLCEHANRRIVRITKDMLVSVLVDKFEGKRLNSPNDLVYKSDGSLYFTDPPYGLEKTDTDPQKELSFNGIYRLASGKLQLLSKDLNRPNGIGFSPDEKTLYVSNSDPQHRYWMRFEVKADGTLGKSETILDVSTEKEAGNPDGLKLDTKGNLYGAGPTGIWIFSPSGKHLGTIKLPEIPTNCTWGDDGKSLYITARTSLYRIKLPVTGQKAMYHL